MLGRYSSCYPRVRPRARVKAGQRFPVPGYSAAPARKVPPFFLPVQVFATGVRWPTAAAASASDAWGSRGIAMRNRTNA